jgi:hypothetical protein
MEYARNALLFCCAIFILSCNNDDCDTEIDCTFISASFPIVILNESGEDLLGRVSADSIEITSLTNLKNLSGDQVRFDLENNFGGTFPTDVNLLRIRDSDIYEKNSEGILERNYWLFEYKRNGVVYLDTIGQTPEDRSSECCISLWITDFDYTGTSVVSVTQEEGFPIYKVIMR